MVRTCSIRISKVVNWHKIKKDLQNEVSKAMESIQIFPAGAPLDDEFELYAARAIYASF